METWIDVKGYEGCYQVSNYGRVKSMRRKVASRNGVRELPEKIIVPLFTKQGYLNVIASKKQVRQTLVVHQLVAECFIGPRPDGYVIDHIDRDKTNNKAENLRYVTASGNQRNRKDNKLTEEDAKNIRVLLSQESQSKIASRYKVSQSLISKIKLGMLWKNEQEVKGHQS